jgi:hypothetical protein
MIIVIDHLWQDLCIPLVVGFVFRYYYSNHVIIIINLLSYSIIFFTFVLPEIPLTKIFISKLYLLVVCK